MLLGISVSAYGKNCSWSQQFQVKRPQIIAGVLLDPNGAVLPGIGIQLWSGGKLVRELRTDSQGAYDMGEVAAGNYRIRIKSGNDSFCGPKVRCTSRGCTLDPKLKINPKNAVTVQ
jgi:hypothetical protein